MPWSMFTGCGLDFFVARAGPGKTKPRNLEEYFYQSRGRRLTQIAAQGFQEKLTGKKWADISISEDDLNGDDAGFFSIMREAIVRASRKKKSTPTKASGDTRPKAPAKFVRLWRQERRSTAVAYIMKLESRRLIRLKEKSKPSPPILDQTLSVFCRPIWCRVFLLNF